MVELEDLPAAHVQGQGVGVGGPGGARLLITKLVMENFKSYGGIREIGPFHKCFSSIVGPNGSGKSNVIDAMLFVFGKRAKKLRLNKVSELIHRSDTFPNLEYARVAVHFVDIVDTPGSEDDYTEVKGTELVVTRTAYMNNSSKYQVDGKNKTFAEVGALLQKRGIDLEHNRFLILQGEVEQIAMMKPKGEGPHDEGLLEYLEDIIGSNRYVESTEAVAKEVDELNSTRSEKLNRLKAAEKEKANLEGAKMEAEAFLAKDRESRVLKNVLYQISVAEAAANIAEVEEKHAELTKKQEHEQGKLKEMEVGVKDIEKRHEAVGKEYAAIEKELIKTKEEFTEYERKDIKYKEDIKFIKGQMKKTEATLKKEEKKQQAAAEKAEALEEKLPKLESQVDRAEKRKASEEAALEEINEGLKEETAELRSQLEGKQAEVVPVKMEYGTIKNKVDTMQCEITLLEESTVSAKKQLADCEAALVRLHEGAASNKEELAQAKEEGTVIDGKIAEAEGEIAAVAERERDAVKVMTKAIAAAEESKASLEAGAGMSKTLQHLMKAAKKGGPLAQAGICGRLGDLGSIDKAHDVAISTACGYLDYIVTDSTDGASSCVEYLKSNNLGRASFIILEQLGHLQGAMSNAFTAPRDCQRLFDLITPTDQKYLPAFFLGLRDTLVAPDLDTAVAVAYQGSKCVARVVTADGQLIDKSGAMSGGGSNVKRGGMSSSGKAQAGMVTEKEVGDLTASAAAQAQADVKAVRDERRAEEGKLKQLVQRKKDLVTLVPKLELKLASVGASEAQYNEQIERYRGQCELGPEEAAKLKDLTRAMAQEQKGLDKVSKVLSKLEGVVQQLQAAILEVGGENLKRAMKRVEAAGTSLDEAVAAVSAAQVDAKAERRKAEKAEKDAKKKEKELEVLQAKYDSEEEKFKGLEDAALVVMQAYEHAQAEHEEKKLECEEMTREYEKRKAVVAKIRSVEVDISNQLEDYTRVAKENAKKRDHWVATLKKLRKTHEDDLAEWGDWDDDDEEEEEDEEQEENAGKCEETGDAVSETQGAEETKGSQGDGDVGGQEGQGQGQAAPGKGEKKEKKKSRKQLRDLTEEELSEYDKNNVQYEIGILEGERDKLKKNVNMSVLLEYKKKEGEYLNRVKDLDEVTESRNEARRRHEELRRKRLEEFMAGFGAITLKLKEMYQMITLGGDAELELVDSLDPFSEGIVFSVRPPKKSWKHIANLSGGEKTLSSLALVFALHHYKPTPLYVMDEIDAALDFKNVSIVANYIKERTKNAQFIIISLRNNMFELADRLVGIYKTHNVTKSVTINPLMFAADAVATDGSAAAPPPAPMALADLTNVAS
ncbi:unnamed protein product [Chrysoparadoxa australica]